MKTTMTTLIAAAVASIASVAAHAAPVNYLVLRTDPVGYSQAATQIKAALRTSCPTNFVVHRYGVNDAGGAAYLRHMPSSPGLMESLQVGQPSTGVCVMGAPSRVVINAPAQPTSGSKFAASPATTLTVGSPEFALEAWTHANEQCRASTLVLPDGYAVFSGSYADGTWAGYAYGHGVLGSNFGAASFSGMSNNAWVGTGGVVLMGEKMQFAAFHHVAVQSGGSQSVSFNLGIGYCQMGGFVYTIGY